MVRMWWLMGTYSPQNPKYFGIGRGITYYNFTSDQFTDFHSIVMWRSVLGLLCSRSKHGMSLSVIHAGDISPRVRFRRAFHDYRDTEWGGILRWLRHIGLTSVASVSLIYKYTAFIYIHMPYQHKKGRSAFLFVFGEKKTCLLPFICYISALL